MASIDEVDGLFDKIKNKYALGEQHLKAEQQEAISSLLCGQDTIALLPTGFGKSLVYTAMPLILDELKPNQKHMAIIVSPLRALMFDQVSRAKAAGIRSVALTQQHEVSDEDKQCLERSEQTLVFVSPEALEKGPWLKIMKKKRDSVSLLVFDELHCLSEWGADFRPAYLASADLRGHFSKAPTLGLSATVNEKVLKDVRNALHISDDHHMIARLPDRPNIYLEIVHQASYDVEDDLTHIASGLQNEQTIYPKTVIFAQSIRQVVDIYEFFLSTLGRKAFVNEDCQPKNRLISMYHGQIAEGLQNYTLNTFKLLLVVL